MKRIALIILLMLCVKAFAICPGPPLLPCEKFVGQCAPGKPVQMYIRGIYTDPNNVWMRITCCGGEVGTIIAPDDIPKKLTIYLTSAGANGYSGYGYTNSGIWYEAHVGHIWVPSVITEDCNGLTWWMVQITSIWLDPQYCKLRYFYDHTELSICATFRNGNWVYGGIIAYDTVLWSDQTFDPENGKCAGGGHVTLVFGGDTNSDGIVNFGDYTKLCQHADMDVEGLGNYFDTWLEVYDWFDMNEPNEPNEPNIPEPNICEDNLEILRESRCVWPQWGWDLYCDSLVEDCGFPEGFCEELWRENCTCDTGCNEIEIIKPSFLQTGEGQFCWKNEVGGSEVIIDSQGVDELIINGWDCKNELYYIYTIPEADCGWYIYYKSTNPNSWFRLRYH